MRKFLLVALLVLFLAFLIYNMRLPSKTVDDPQQENNEWYEKLQKITPLAP